MFCNTDNVPKSRTWDLYNPEVALKPNINLNQHTKSESRHPQGNQRMTKVEKGSIMNIAIEQSGISPAGSLNSVGSLPLSSLDNSNGETIDEGELDCFR